MQRQVNRGSHASGLQARPARGVGACERVPSDAAPDGDRDVVQPSFDPTRLYTMLHGDREKMLEVVCYFVEDFPSQVAELEHALAESDVTKAEFLAHTLKGATANLGFLRVCDAAGRMEEALNDDRAEDAGTFLAVLREEMSAVTIDVVYKSL